MYELTIAKFENEEPVVHTRYFETRGGRDSMVEVYAEEGYMVIIEDYEEFEPLPYDHPWLTEAT